MSDARKRLYIGFIADRADATSGVGVFTTWGFVTEDGEWVEQKQVRPWKSDYEYGRTEVVRTKVTPHWQETPEAALAVLSPRIRAIGERLLRQADELEQNGGPALATVAATSGDMGRPAAGGE
jgi:hypothetical protein